MKFSIAAILAIALAGSVSAQNSTILETVIASDNHNTLEAAVLAASPSIADLLSGSVELTLFAPDDEAFAGLPSGTVDLLTSAPWQPHLDCVLKGHVYTVGAVLSADIPASLTVESAEPGYNLTLANDNTTVTVNDIEVAAADLGASNGVIHVLSDGVLLPACVTENIPSALTSAGTFETLLNLVDSAGLVDALSGDPTAEGLTVMAPTDAAFQTVPEEILDYLSTNETALMAVLTYHVIGQNVVPTESGAVATLQGENITVTVEGDTITLNDGGHLRNLEANRP